MSPDPRPSPVVLAVDLPAAGSVSGADLVIYGWTFGRERRIVEVEARLGERRTSMPLGVHRADVALEIGEPLAEWCGFEGLLRLEAPALESVERLVVRAIDEHGEGTEVEVPVRILPAGTSVLEVELARWSGDRIEIEGWLLWPGSTDPRTLALSFGETRIAETRANLSRPDVARRFPDAPRGSCRGFRLAVSASALGLQLPERLELRLAGTDRAGRALDAQPLPTLERSPEPSDNSQESILQVESDVAELPLPEISILLRLDERTSPVEGAMARLRETLPAEFRGEVLVVDELASDAVSTELARWEERWPRVRIVRDEAHVGFALCCLRAAELARGELLVFLGSDSLPRPDWLPPLARLLQEAPATGAACGKLLRPDGTLDSAGGVLFADGSTSGFGRGDGMPNRPLFDFVREVDSCSSDLLAVRRSAFLECGGFDPQFHSAEALGADLCFRLRARGVRVRYQPSSVVMSGRRSASDSDGVDSEPAARAESELFRARWQGVLAAQPARPAILDLAALHALSTPAEARRALVCAPRMPEFDRDSGSRRVFHLVDLMQQAGWAVSYLAARSVGGDRYLRLLQQRGVTTYAGPDSIGAGDEYVEDVGELFAEGRFELAIVAFWSIAERLLPEIRRRSPATRVLVDSVDLHFLREERAARSAFADSEPSTNAERRLDRKRRELATYGAADAVLTVSAKEAEIVAEATSRSVPTFCVPDLEEMALSRLGFHARSGLLFVGNFHHPPNLEGLEYLCREILPLLDDSVLAAHPLSVVGHGVNDRVLAAVAKVPHANVVGWVPSVVPYLERSRVSLVPLLHGAGTKRKLLQALMVGTPSVSTSIGAEGLDLEHGRQIVIADSAGEFAVGIERLTTEPIFWNRVAREGRRQVERAHGRRAVEAALRTAVQAVTSTAVVGRAARASSSSDGGHVDDE